MSQLMKKRFPSITSIDVGTDGNTSFLRAARNGQLEKVLEHLESNIDINTSNANGLNALHLASKDGHVEIVEELLKRGAVIDAATKKGNTALHIASLAGQEEVVKLLVTHGASVNVQSQNGFTPLYMAAQENHDNVVKYLLSNGANQSLSTEDGFTPLAVAMQQGHDKVVTVLLENDTRGKVRLPALHIAAKKDDVKAAKLLLENEHNPDVTSKSGFTPLHIASHYGNQAIANLLVQKGADVNYAAKHNITPLHVAAKWGKTNMVTVLLETGANIESKTRDGLTPLHCAARSGHEQVVDMLLEKGAPISSKTKNGLAPLHMAAQGDHVDAARILLYHRAPVDEVTVDYLTALHVAAHCGHVRVAKLLLDRQADANARALNGFTPLHIACKKNRIKVVELLLKHGASIGATTESGLTPLHVASFMGCMNIVIYLLQHDANPDVPTVRGETPLHLAARANQTDIIRILLRNGAQVDARAREQQTPLHIASRLGNVDIVMLLLQHGAKVDHTTKDMYTALHIAAKEGQDEVAAALIDNGASLNATTKKGFTPLHLAAKYGHLKVAKLLLQKEAPVDAQGKNGVTPLHVASHYDHQNVALLLLEKGASPYATAKNGHTPLHIAAKKNQMDIANTLLEYGAKPNAESKAGFTPLHLSAQEGHCDMTDLLIEHKADTNHTARNGLTPLHLCAQEDKVPVAEILVKNGGEVDAATKNGYTPLHIACHYGQINMVRFLLSHGANVKAITSLGYTPLHQAAQQGHTNIVNTLLENAAHPNAVTNSGQTPLHIAEKLGYITVIDTLKVVTQPLSPMSMSAVSNDEKYRVVAPEAMHETFMSDSEEEGGEDTVLGDQTYRYLTADEMKSLGDDSLPIDVTRDERIDSNKMVMNENMLPPRHIEDNISPEHVQPNYVEYIKKYTPDNVDIDKHPISIGFLVSFLVDARGGAMRGCRHSGVRVIVPPRCAPSPTRITCRYVRPQRTPHPPPLMEGEALASRVLELGPVGAKFLGPVIIEVPHFAALRGKEREIVILRSDNGESWKEHTVEATEEVLNEVLHDSFEAEDLNQLEDISSGRITRIVTQDFPQYFAVVSRVRQEVHAIGPEGGMVSSTVVPQVQAVFPQGALTKKIKVGLQAQPIDPELTAKLLGHGVAVSPVVTVEPRRRKFHKAITLSMPAPRAHSQGMINQYSGSAPTLRLLCSITGGTTRAQWEDVTGSTPLTFVNDCVSFTTTVSARFWLMDCRNVGDATKMATELYREAIHVPFMAKFVVFAKRVDPLEARLRVFCMTDDKEDKTLEHQEHFTEVAKSRDVEVLEGKPQYIEFAGNLVPITKSGEQLQFSFRAFRENRLPFSVRVKDQHAEAVSRCLFMREQKLPKGEPPQQPICILNIVLPDDIVVDTISLTDSDSVKKIDTFDYYRPDPRLADMSNLLGDDWVPLAAQLGLTTSEINVIKSEYPDSVAKQAQSMLRMWLSQSGNKAQANTLESALRRIGREDIIPQCLNVDYPPHGIKEIEKQRLIKKISVEQKLYEKDIMESAKNDNFDKYSAEEKVVEETSDEEDFNKTVTERRQQIQERLAVDRTVPASSQRVEIVQEISSIKRQSLVENKIAEVEQKAAGEVVDGVKTTVTSNELTISPAVEKVIVDGDRRDSELLEGVTQRFEQKMITRVISAEDPKSPKVSKTPPPSPADFITKEQAAAIQEWDVSKKSAPQEEAVAQGAEQQGLSTTTERLVASNEETLLDKPLGQQLTGFSVIDDLVDLKTVCEQTNAFIQSESQPEPYDALADKYTRKEPINDKKVDDNKNNMNEKKKAKKGFFGSIKTFVERSFESDSESEKSPKKSKKPKKEKKKKIKEEGLPPRKPKLPTPPLEPSDIDSIPFAEASVSDIPPPYKPPEVPIPVTDLDADLELKPEEKQREKTPVPKEKEPEKSPKVKAKDKKKAKAKTIVVEEVTKTIEPFVIEAEEFSIIVDPTKKESPKKSKETFTINIDESFDKIEKKILEKKPILTDEKIVKPLAALEMKSEAPVRPPRTKDHVYEDIEEPAVTIPQERIKDITTDLIQNEINFGGWSDTPAVQKEDEAQKEIVEKQDKEVLKEKDGEGKKKEEKKGGFFGLFKKKDSKKEEEPLIEKVEKEEKQLLSEAVLKDMADSNKFLLDEVQNYHDVRPVSEVVTTVKPEIEEAKAQSESFFGLFKKPKVPSEKKTEAPEKKARKGEEKKAAVVLSEEVLKNILDSKRFLEGEVQNYDDVIAFESTREEEKVVESPPPKKIVTPSPKKKTDEPSPKKKAEEKREASPKKTLEERRESSPKSSPGFFGLFKKPKKDEVDAEETKVEFSEEVVKDMKETDQFLVAEIEHYHDVKPLVEETKVEESVEVVKVVSDAAEVESGGFFGLFKKPKKEEEKKDKEKKVEKKGEEKKVEKKEEEKKDEKILQLSETTLKDMAETNQFLSDEVQNYHDVKALVEEKKEETVEAVKVGSETAEVESGGFFGLFKKTKKEDEKKEEKKKEEKKDEKIPLSETTLRDMADTDQFLSDEVQNYHDVRPAKEEFIEEEKVTESAEQPSSGFFGLFKKTKKEDEKIVPEVPKEAEVITIEEKPEKLVKVEEEKVRKVVEEVRESSPRPTSGFFGLFKKSKKDEEETVPAQPPLSDSVVKDMDDTNQFLSREIENFEDVKPAKFEAIQEEKVFKVVDKTVESSPKSSRGLFGLFKSKSKKEEEEPPEPKVVSEIVVKEMEETTQFLIDEVENYHDVKPEEEKPSKVVEEEVESSPKSSRGLFGIFKKSKKEEEAPEAKPVISEAALQAINDTSVFLTDEIDNYQDVKPAKFEAIEEEKVSKVAEETVEASPKSSRGLFGMFKKSKKDQDDVEPKTAISESVEKDIVESETLLTVEVGQYDDTKPVEEEKKKVEEIVDSKPSKGLFGIFKKSKKEEEETTDAKPVISEAVVKEMDETHQFLTGEVENYHDAKPEEKEEKVVRIVEEGIEASPKSGRGIFGILKKAKKEEEKPIVILSEQVLKDMVDTDQFLIDEVENYHDVKVIPEEKVDEKREASPRPTSGLFGIFKKSKKEEVEIAVSEAVQKDVEDTKEFLVGEVEKYDDAKLVDETREASPRPTSGLFGLFKKSKKEEIEVAPISDLVQKDVEDAKEFLVEEFEKLEDSKPVVVEETREASPRPTSGLFGIFKKSSKKEDIEVPPVSEAAQKEVEDTKEFLVGEVEKYEDAKPVDETREASPRPTSGLFGIFKKSKKEEIEVPPVSETVQKEMEVTKEFLVSEVEKYEDVKPVVVEETKPASGLFGMFKKSKKEEIEVSDVKAQLSEAVEDTTEILVEEVDGTREASPRPTSGLFGIFKKSKKEEVEVLEIKAPVAEAVQKDIDDTKDFLVGEVEKFEDVKLVVLEEEVKLTTPDIEAKPEVKGGFLSKFKKTKKKPSLAEAQLSEETQKSMDETKNFLSTELANYEDGEVEITDKKEEKTVTFDGTKSQMVLEAHLPQPEVPQVVDVVKTEIADLEKETKEELIEVQDVVLQEAKEAQQIIEEIKPSKKDKQSKDKKGFFNIFGKKSKSQEASFDEARGRPEEQSEGSPKKQKRRKSSSPFKFFDKMKKSEEEVKEEAEILAPPPIEDVSTEEAKDDLLAVEFEDQPAMDLSEEVLGSLDKKMEQLKHKYTPETQKQINDCRDFLFIEVDNYEDAKPVVVTDIDTGLSTDAGKAVDDIIGKASKVVEDTQKQVEVEVDRKGAKKGDRKSGFFSKLGNLISGSADEAKSELKEAKKSAADKAKEAADSAAKSVEDGAKKSKEKLKETQKAASDKAAETKDAAKELKETVVKGTGEKIDEAKQGVLSLKESLMEIKAKTGGKIDDLKRDAADQAQAASETVVEFKDAAIRKADRVKDSVETTKADIQKSGQEVVDDAAKKVEDVKATVDETKTDLQKSVQELLDAATEKAEDSVKTSVDAAGKRIEGVKAAVDETKAGVQKSGQEFVDIASKKTEDVKDSVKASVDAAGTKIDGVKATVDETKTDIQKSGQELLDAAGKKAEDVKSGVKAAVDEADKKVDGVKVTIDDTKTDIQKSGQELVATADRKTQDVKDGVKATVDATGKKIEHAKDDVKATVDDTKADLQKSGQELLDTAGRKTQDVKDGVKATVDATGKKIEAVKDNVKATADDTKADLQKSCQEILDAAAKKTEDVKSSVKATVHAADKKVDSVKATIDDTKTGIQKSAQQFVDSAGKKSADVKDSVKASVDAAGKKAEDVKDSVKASVDAVGKKAEDVKDSAKASVDTAGKKIEGVKATVVETKTDIQKSGQEFLDSASKKLDAVKQTTEETKIKTQEAAKSVADVTAKKIDDVKKGAADVIAQKAEDVDKARKVVVDSTSQKVEDVKLAAEKGKEIATETLEKIGDETKPRIEEVGKAKDETVDKAAKKLEEAKKDTQIITQKVASATDKAKTQGADKVEEICKGAEGVVEHVQASAKAKGDRVIDAKDQAIEDLSKTKESAKAAAAQKIDDVSTTAAKAKDSVLGDFMKMKESVQESADHKVEEIKKAKDSVQSAIATKADELKKTKDGVQDTVAGKVDQAKITVSQKVEDVAQAKDAAGRKAEDFAKAAGQKIDDLAGAKDAVTRKADDMSKAAAEDLTKTKQKTEDVLKAAKDTVQERASEKLDQVGKSVSEKADDFATSATKRVDQAKDAVATKIGGVTQVVSQKVEEIAKVKESVKDTASQKLDDLVQAKEDVKQIAAQKVEGVAADAAKAKDEALKTATEIKDTTSQKVDHFAEMALQRAEDVTSQKVKEATHKVEDVFVQKVDDLGKIERGTEAKIVDELSKMKQGVGSDLSKTKKAGEKKMEDLSKTTAQKAAEVRDVASGFFSAFAEEKKKETDAKLIDLDDELAKLTSSLEQLSQPVKSYVTSPTSARRSESQRISREERPTVREVRSLPSEDSTEEHYTITEPEDTDEKRRKPLFHMESEDDDSADISKSRDRRDSVRSNVLETLTEHKLDNLLSDLVQDLEKSVAEGKEQPLTQLSKAETELEAMTKDSQADVEQIEQKLRDLDKALDSLEQASDPKLEKKLHRVERKFERMASDVMEGVPGTSPTEVEARRENEFQKLVSQLSTEEVSDFQKEYSHLWDETTFSKSEEWDSKTPDSQLDVLELPQGEESSFAATGRQEESTLKAEGEEAATGGQQTDRTSAQQRPISDQHQLSEEMKQLLKELEKESKQ